MTRRRQTKLVHEGQYAAEVEVELIEEEPDGRHICRLRRLKSWIQCERLYARGILSGRVSLPVSSNSRLLLCDTDSS